MALKKKTRIQQDRKSRGLLAPLPHSSWRLAPAGGQLDDIPIASASEFWSRLGL